MQRSHIVNRGRGAVGGKAGSHMIIDKSNAERGNKKMNLIELFVAKIRKHPKLMDLLKKAAHNVFPETMVLLDPSLNQMQIELPKKTAHNASAETVVLLDYPVNSMQRWNKDRPHPILSEIINKNRKLYKSTLQAFLPLSMFFENIPAQKNKQLSIKRTMLD
jgi:hypothetical protein